MAICHEHNLASPVNASGSFGIRVRLRNTDPFRNLVGGDWNKEHWFMTASDRDTAFVEMSGRYTYFRPGDQPALVFDKIQK
ncbi:MAG TPA: hypothetical protein VK629_05815 [Steroidobacteraceae bacterium]|nr:hypothetical protein [Steroidobacteraceae bacterium]